MIKSFGNKETQRIWNRTYVKNIPKSLQNKAYQKLQMIDAAEAVEDLKSPPGNRLEKKKGDLKEFYAIRVNDQFRIIFRWKNGSAFDVEFVDYH